jgi:hypothetical protein
MTRAQISDAFEHGWFSWTKTDFSMQTSADFADYALKKYVLVIASAASNKAPRSRL